MNREPALASITCPRCGGKADVLTEPSEDAAVWWRRCRMCQLVWRSPKSGQDTDE